MKLSKNQTVMCAIGGVAGIGVCVLGYLLFSTMSEKSEAEEMRDVSLRSIQGSSVSSPEDGRRKLQVLETNKQQIVAWCLAATNLAARGDRERDTRISGGAFKQTMETDARRLEALPGMADGKIVRKDFDFGFPDYVRGGKVPEKSTLPALQRRWGDICQIVEMFAKCEVGEIVRIEVNTSKETTPADDRNSSRYGRNSAPAKPAYTRERYTLEFLASPAALVATVNALTTDTRFFVIDSLTFVRGKDDLKENLVTDKDKEAKDQPTSRRRRRQQAEAKEVKSAPAKEEIKGRVVIDPETATPFKVTLGISTYDFGTKEETKEVKK